MPQEESDILGRVARAIADGRPIAWDELAGESPELRKRLRNLHAIQTLASSSRGRAIQPEAPARATEVPSRGIRFRWGKLDVLERIGAGSFGEVFRAFDPILEREVALKLRRRSRAKAALAGSDAGSHLEEARRLARLRHGNVLTVHGIEEHDGREGMWTDYIRGRTLEAIVLEDGPLPVGEIERIGCDLCSALGAVHDAGLAHGDVKPANVMREDSGRIVLMDFGAGSNLRRRSGSKPPVRGPAAGTPLVMAPELFAGGSPSPAADLYAAGVLLYRLATGRYPVMATTRRELVARLREGTHVVVSESRPDLSPHVAEAIERALRTRPEERFPSAAAMRAALDSGDAPLARLAPTAQSPHLPRETARLIGREREIKETRRLVLQHRLVTLVGAGGSGKTRLALRAAMGLADAFAEGARWIDLAPLSAPGRLAAEIAHAAGVREEPRREISESLVENLRGRAILLVLDNCEHLRDEVSSLSLRLVHACPALHLLVTSRIELGLPEERIVAVGPLPTPACPAGAAEGVEITEVESVRLFLDRACTARPDFILTAANAPAVARICRRVEGIPLALTLAAARVRAMSVDQIAARLEESFRLLAGGGDEGLPHHKTIQASIDWSYRLLDPGERTMLRRLALFAGKWSLEAAESACSGSAGEDAPGDSAEEADAFDAILSLVDKSLVLYEPAENAAGGEPAGAYRMLEMVRAFARERLLPGEEAAVRARQASYYEQLTERARTDLVPQKEGAWFDRFEGEHDNLRDILDWCCRHPGFVEAGMRIAVVLRRFWLIRGYWREGREILEALLSAGGGSPALMAQTLHSAASIAVAQSDYEGTARLGNEALERMRELGDRKGTAQMLSILGIMAIDQAQYDLARNRIEEALAIDRELGNTAIIPQRLSNLGSLAARTGDFAGAARRFEEALTHFRAAGDLRSAAVLVGNLSTASRNLGDFERARELAEEHLAMTRALGGKVETAGSLRTLGLALLEGKDIVGARRNLLESLQLERGMENRVQVVWCLEAMSHLFRVSGDVQGSLRLMGATEAFRAQLGTPQPEPDRILREQGIAELEERLGVSTVIALLGAGRSMSWEEAIEFAGGGPGASP